MHILYIIFRIYIYNYIYYIYTRVSNINGDYIAIFESERIRPRLKEPIPNWKWGLISMILEYPVGILDIYIMAMLNYERVYPKRLNSNLNSNLSLIMSHIENGISINIIIVFSISNQIVCIYIYGKSPFYSWENPLFLWSFSIAILT